MDNPNYFHKYYQQYGWKFIALVIFIVALPLIVALIALGPRILSSASITTTATISLLPSTAVLPPDATFDLQLTATTPLVFAQVDIAIPPQVRLTNVSLVQPFFNQLITPAVLDQSAYDQANATGHLVLAVGLQPLATPPSGAFSLAQLTFSANPTPPNTLVSLTFPSGELVDSSVTELAFATLPATLTINPAVATPTSTPIPTPIPTTTSVPPSGTPVPGDTQPPLVQLTYPTSGLVLPRNTSVSLTASASDNTAISKVEFRVDGALKCTDTTAPYACTWKIPAKPNVTYTITATAYDLSANSASSSVTVSTAH